MNPPLSNRHQRLLPPSSIVGCHCHQIGEEKKRGRVLNDLWLNRFFSFYNGRFDGTVLFNWKYMRFFYSHNRKDLLITIPIMHSFINNLQSAFCKEFIRLTLILRMTRSTWTRFGPWLNLPVSPFLDKTNYTCSYNLDNTIKVVSKK